MVSDFRKKKLVHVFHTFFDTDKSGSVDKSDFDLAAEKIAKLRGWAVGDAKYKEAHDALMKVWDGLQKKADSDNDGKISADEWVAMCDDFVKNPTGNEWHSLYMKFIFSLEDASRDGAIDKDEFASVYESFGLKKDECIASFQKMAQGKSNVSWAEFQQLWKEYFTSDDPNAPGNYIFGKSSF